MRRTLALLTTPTLCLPALAADITIDDLAPPETAFVLRIHDFTSATEAFKETPLWKTTERTDITDWLTSIWEDETFTDLRNEFEELGIEPDEYPLPTGHVGIALWDTAEDLPPGILFAADFADTAQDAYDLILEAAERAEARGEMTIEIDDAGDYEILILTDVIDLEARQARHDEIHRIQNAEGLTWEQEQEHEELKQDPDELTTDYYALADGWILSAADLDHLADALDRFSGDDLPSLAGSRDLATLRAKFAGAHADVVIMPDAVTQFFETVTDSFGIFLPIPLDGPLGFDQINGAAASLTIDAPDAQLALNIFIPLDEPAGLFTLIGELDNFTPPAFVSANTANVSAIGINFNALLPLARDFVMSFPAEGRAEMEASLAAFSIIAAPILQSIGPELYIAQRYTRPYSASSQTNLIAIRVKNENVIASGINQYAQVAGTEPRDFLGSQIWEAPDFTVNSPAIGLGAGWAFIGPPEDIEDAFRTLADTDPDTLANNPTFKDAITPLKPAGAAYAFADIIATLEYNQWISENIEDYVRSIYTDQDWIDDEYIEYIVEDVNESPLFRLLKDAPDVTTLRDATGPTIQDYHLTTDGIEARWLILNPE